jgi:outer membrane protein assembly factor BamB
LGCAALTILTGDPEPDPFVYLRKAHVFPNGDLLTFFEKVNVTPWGIALVRVNEDGDLIWSYRRPIHHDFDVGPDGRIYALDSNIVKKGMPRVSPKYFPLLDDEIVILSDAGSELRRLSITKALAESPYRRLMSMLQPRRKGDLLHANSIKVVTAELADMFAFLEAGQVVVSIREANMIAAIDMESAQVTWAAHGYWLRQHDVDLLANGNFLLFDNRGHFGDGGMSRVIEFDPKNMQVVWQYAGNTVQPLHSEIRSAQTRLANGNTLITESDQGRLLEVTPDQQIVWDYRSQWRNEGDPSFTSVLSWAERIGPGYFDDAFGRRLQEIMQPSFEQ